MDNSVLVPRAQLRRLGDELAGALRAVTQARGSSDALEVLTQVTMAIEELPQPSTNWSTCCWTTDTAGVRSLTP